MRLAMLMTHYRSPIDWTEKALEEAEKTLRKWRRIGEADYRHADVFEPTGETYDAVIAALSDDLNTPKAIAALHKAANEGRAADLNLGAELLGLLTNEFGNWSWNDYGQADENTGMLIDHLLSKRKAAKEKKDYSLADKIRDGILAAGVEVKDTPDGAEWSLMPSFDAAKLSEIENV